MNWSPWVLGLASALLGTGPAMPAQPSPATPAVRPAGPAVAPSALPSVEAVLDRWIAARGGREALLGITNCVAVGQADAAHLGSAARCELHAQAPRQRMLSFQLPGQGTVVECFDGRNGWLDDPAFGRTDWTGEELAKRRRDATFHRELEFRALYPDLRVNGGETVDGEPAWLLEAHATPATEERFWFSQRTGLLIRQESTLHLALGLVERSVAYADFRNVAGVRFPHRWQLRQRGVSQAEPEVTVAIRFDTVQFNVPIEPARFRRHEPD